MLNIYVLRLYRVILFVIWPMQICNVKETDYYVFIMPVATIEYNLTLPKLT